MNEKQKYTKTIKYLTRKKTKTKTKSSSWKYIDKKRI